MKTYDVHFAHTGERQHVTAQDWQSAARSTGRADACVLDKRTCLQSGRVSIYAAFDPGLATIITCRIRDPEISDADLRSFALSCVAQELNAANAGAGEVE